MTGKTKAAPVSGAREKVLQKTAAGHRAIAAIDRLADQIAKSGELLSEVDIWRMKDRFMSDASDAFDTLLMVARS